jgi:hypothetical protein
MSERVSPSTAIGIRGMVGAILKSAVGDRLIPASPLDAVPPLQRPARKHPLR